MKKPEQVMKEMMEELHGTDDEKVYQERSNRKARQANKRLKKLQEIFRNKKGKAAK